MTQKEEVGYTAVHTPGPWKAMYVGCERATLIGTADGETAFARMEQFDGTPSHVEMAAIARLITAAPELLEIVAIFLGHDDRFQIAVGGNPSAVDAMLESARAVYAKATHP
jgi:hypothetical protein